MFCVPSYKKNHLPPASNYNVFLECGLLNITCQDLQKLLHWMITSMIIQETNSHTYYYIIISLNRILPPHLWLLFILVKGATIKIQRRCINRLLLLFRKYYANLISIQSDMLNIETFMINHSDKLKIP